ncbi:hypothetical protein [Streptomyces sp. HUAS ZL42]
MDTELESLQMLIEPTAAGPEPDKACGFTIGCVITISWTTEQW